MAAPTSPPRQRIAAGAPIVIVQPGQVYGPGDHSALGPQLDGRPTAARLRYIALGDVGRASVHVDDLAAGILAALDRGRTGEAYVLGGRTVRLERGAWRSRPGSAATVRHG